MLQLSDYLGDRNGERGALCFGLRNEHEVKGKLSKAIEISLLGLFREERIILSVAVSETFGQKCTQD